MKRKTSLVVLLASLGLIGSTVPVFTGVFDGEGTAYDLPSEMLYLAPASVNSPHTYTNSPTNEPWYKDAHNFKNTAEQSDGVYYARNQKTTMYERMNVTGTWNSYRGENVKVAVIDTGCYTGHEDFNGTNIKTISKNMVSSTTGFTAVNDTNGHGTSSAATIAAAVNSVGGTGIAPNVDLIILKCVNDEGVFSTNAINNALQYCIDNDVDIINMSLQGYNVNSNFSASWIEDFGNYAVSETSKGIMRPTNFSTKINACYNAGITIVAAAGNYNTNKESYPAANDHVIAVASTGLTEENKLKKAGYSNYGTWVDICAPGYVTTPLLTSSSSYSVTNGTSFSAPLVTGAIALYKSKYPDATPDQIEKALKATATAVDWQGGAGAINVGAFLDHAPDVLVESVTLSEQYKTIKVGETYQISPTVLPTGANTSILYESSDPDICSVSSTGLVKALKTGSSIIECSSSENSDIYDMVEVTVEAASSSTTNITYWADWISKNQSSINTGGTTLLSALRTKISNVAPGNENTISYDGLWDAYATTDGIPGSNGTKIYDMYGGFEFTKGTDQAGNYQKEGDVYNREHSVPKSWFSKAKPAYSDIVHVVPTDGKVNGMRGNNTFGEVSNASYSYSFPARSYNGVQYQLAGISKLGSPKTINGESCPTSVVFEPDDQYKGDFARIYMYFATRYGGTNCDPTKESGGTAIFQTECTDSNPYMTNYGLALIRKWHEQDPVSEKEKLRNDGIEQTQGNRNPFVDYPKWADKIFGTHTGPAEPTVTISQTTASIPSNGSIQLTATASDGSSITWSSSNNNAATVSSSGLVSGVAAGSTTITASATIEEKTYSATCLVTVTAPESPVASISVSGDMTKKTYNVGDSWSNAGLVVTATRENGNQETVSNSDVSWSYNPTKPALSTTFVIVTATYRSKTDSKTISGLTVKEETGDITITDNDIPTKYSSSGVASIKKGDQTIKFNVSNVANYNNGVQFQAKNGFISNQESLNISSVELVTKTSKTFNGTLFWGDSANPSKNSVAATNGNTYKNPGTYRFFKLNVGSNAGYIDKLTIHLGETENIPVTGVNLSSSTLSLNVGQSETLNATIEPDNASNKSVTWESSNQSVATVNNGQVSAVGTGTATITVKTVDGNKTATCSVTVSAAPVVNIISVSVSPSSLSLNVGGSSTLTASISPNNATNKNVTWRSSDTNIVTVENGVVTAIAEGTATITVETEDGNKTATCFVIVSSSPIPVDNNITITNSATGITTTDGTQSISVSSYTFGGYFKKFTNTYVTPNVEALWFTKGAGYIYNKISLGKIKKITMNYANGSSSDAAHCLSLGTSMMSSRKTSPTNGSSYSSSSGSNSFTSSGNYGFFNISVTSANKNLQISSIVVELENNKATAMTWSQSFFNSITCDGGVTMPNKANWASMKTAFSALESSQQLIIRNASYVLSGSIVTPDGGVEQIIAEAVARYDYIVAKYGVSNYENFISRDVSLAPVINIGNYNLQLPLSTTMIVVVSLLGTSLIVGYFYYKKRKEN